MQKLCVLLLWVWLAIAVAAEPEPGPVPVTRISFGSCCHQDRPQLLWQPILATRPELFILAGDNVYIDTREPERFAQVYARLDELPDFQKLRSSCELLGTWDDHDYGWNDAGKEYELKEQSKKAFLDFFRAALDDPRRQRGGIYHARKFGPQGRRLQVILLDTRWFRDPVRKDTRPREERRASGSVGWYLPHEKAGAEFLGEEQWTWLEQQLRQPAELRLLVSSVQFAAEGRGMEGWANFPHERARMLKLIETTGANGVLFLSGDVHFAELSCVANGPYPIYDFTSSGLAQSTGPETNLAWSRSSNRNRLPEMVESGPNFGSLKIDWRASTVTLRAHTLQGRVSFEKTVSLADLMVD